MKKIDSKEIIEKMKIVTRHPNRNWRKILLLLISLALISFAWNIYFFFSVKSAITQADISASLPQTGNISKENEINKILKFYDEKRVKFNQIENNRAPILEDPAVS